jgi:RNA-splicing ligase RtcB
MLPEGQILDEETTKQIYSFLSHPAFKGEPIVIMPDAHAGKGSCIGFTMPMNDYIIPNIVGVDIGCGMTACELDVPEIDFEALDKFIRNNIPSGHSIHSDTNHLRFAKQIDMAIYEQVSNRIGQSVDVLKSLGTLGGGNHFIEINKRSDGQFVLVVHSGSRNLGLKVAEYHTNKAKSLMTEMFIGDAYKGLEFLTSSTGKEEYLEDMNITQTYASLNRHIIVKTIMEQYFKITSWDDSFECIHNYINFNDIIIRKGAISANLNEPVIIPLNMRDGIIFGRGKGNKMWNNSAPHGAGRILSRKKAKEQLNLDEAKESMEGIWTSSLSENTLDEAPNAYKDSQMIIEAISESVDIEFVAKPVYNFKAS